jgi:hypothetical protein
MVVSEEAIEGCAKVTTKLLVKIPSRINRRVPIEMRETRLN